ncbi:type-F conjugative transfer system secretin TraK [Pasteurella multocida]|uniref:TraK domain-containing protein n=1 Tax=Pasteurella multocida TaxID=747 RepID=UPI002FDFA9F5
MKNLISVLTLSTLLSYNAIALDLISKPFGTVYSTISSTEPNIVHVKNDSIVGISSKSGAIIQDSTIGDGSVMFSTKENKPFSILIETEKGYTFTLKATPKQTSSMSIVINNFDDKGSSNESVQQILNYPQTYSGFISYVFTEILNKRLPNGFIESSNKSYQIDKSMQAYFKVKNTEAWVGQNVRVVKIEIKNISKTEFELNERYFWNKNVMAITFDPKTLNLYPQSTVYAYVMLREVE